MIDYETFSRIKHLHLQKGLTAMQIATTDAQIYRVPCIGLLPGAHKIFCRKDTSRQNRSLLLG